MGKKLDDSYFKMYEDLLEDESNDTNSVFRINKNRKFFDEEPERFITDDELEEKIQKQNNPDLPRVPKGPIKIEEQIQFKRYTKRHQHKYTEKEMEEIRKGCEESLVHDYSKNDMYHLSDEEREKLDSLAKMRVKIGKLHKTYGKVDEYIEAMRIFVEAWELLEKEENYLHSEEEFFKMVAEGKIYNSSIIMPHLRKMDKYNKELLYKYICNPNLDPKDLVANKNVDPDDDFYYEDDETAEDKMERLLSPEEALFVEQYEDNPPDMEFKEIKNKYIKGYDQKNFYNSKKKKLSKKEKFLVNDIHRILNRIQNNVAYANTDMYAKSWYITSSLFEKEKKKESVYDKIPFDGSWTSKDDLMLYDLAIQEEIANEHPYGEMYLTNSDKQLSEFFKVMEENGLNVVELRRRMNMSENDLKENDIKKTKRENRKKEAAIMQRITKLNGDPKFKKLVSKAEKAINEHLGSY